VSTKQKRKPKAKAPPKEKRRVVRKRAPAAPKKPRKEEVVIEEKKVAEAPPEKTFILAIRLSGSVAVPARIETTLTSLRLKRRFSAVVLESKPDTLGMLRVVKDYITWGEVKSDTLAALLKERARTQGGMRLTDDFVNQKFGERSIVDLAVALTRGKINLKSLWANGLKSVFRLRPPSGGFAHNIKRAFNSRGELGYRGEHIADLVARMV